MPESTSADGPGNVKRAAMRAAAIAERLAMPRATLDEWNHAICDRLLARIFPRAGSRIAFCWPIRNEPDIRRALLEWEKSGALLCLPVVDAVDQPLRFRLWSAGTAMTTDRYGIPTPADGDFVLPDLVFIPLNAFDAAGYRIGYGGGYFDRTLAALPRRPLAIGIGYEIGRVGSVRPELHDQKLDGIFTEAEELEIFPVGIRRFNDTGG